MDKAIRLSNRIAGDLYEQLEQCAREDGTSVSAIAREALREYCEQRTRACEREDSLSPVALSALGMFRQRRRPFRPNERDVEKALAAFRRICGAVSDGRLSQDIDDGP
jgi:hypothetical protein